MKKLLSLLLAISIMGSVSGCGSQNSQDDIVKDESSEVDKSSTENIESEGETEESSVEVTNIELVTNYTEEGNEEAIITAYDKNSEVVWTYETPGYPATELTQMCEIGWRGDRYYFTESGSVLALDANTGDIVWRNNEFGGASVSSAFGNDAMYLCGGYGPDFYAINYDGASLRKIESLHPDYFWAYGIKVEDNKAIIAMEGGPDGDMEYPKYFYVDLETYEVSEDPNTTTTTSSTTSSGGAWKNAYIKFIDEQEPVYGINNEREELYSLVDVNGDEVPELYMAVSIFATGDTLCTYANGEVKSVILGSYGFSYVEGQNIILDSGGHMDVYYDAVYKIDGGDFVEVHRGEYGLIGNSSEYKYIWDGEEVVDDAYTSKLDSVTEEMMVRNPMNEGTWDDSLGRIVGDGLYTYDQIKDVIQNYR